MSLGAAFKAFFQALKGVELIPKSEIPPPPPPLELPPPVDDKEIFANGAVYALVLLQREGRLIDFLQEDISGFPNDQVGIAVRQIHENCQKVLSESFAIKPVRSEDEQSRIEVADGFDPSAIRLTGTVPESGPFAGTLVHRGWRASAPKFPERSGEIDATVIAPAEVEIS
jgi:hypothetical protein